MLFAEKGLIPPEEWYHSPEYQNKYGNTVAMIFASKGHIPPKEWEHKPEL